MSNLQWQFFKKNFDPKCSFLDSKVSKKALDLRALLTRLNLVPNKKNLESQTFSHVALFTGLPSDSLEILSSSNYDDATSYLLSMFVNFPLLWFSLRLTNNLNEWLRERERARASCNRKFKENKRLLCSDMSWNCVGKLNFVRFLKTFLPLKAFFWSFHFKNFKCQVFQF